MDDNLRVIYQKMALPDDVLFTIKEFSKPLPNSDFTRGLTDKQISEFFVDTWAEDKFDTNEYLNYNIIFSHKGCSICIYDYKFVYYEYNWSIKELREWDGNVCSHRSAQVLRCV